MKRAAQTAILVLLAGAAGCDSFDAPAAGAATSAPGADDEKARGAAREALTAVVKAAGAAAASCVAGELLWEADPDGNAIARHMSRPCIPERCSPSAAEIDGLRTSTRAARKLLDGEIALRVPSYQGVVAVAEAMVAFTDTALAGGGKDKAARLSGLSMHYRALAIAYRALYPESQVPLEQPALTTSLAVEQPGGDPCKGWQMPRHCDVRGVRVPKERRWRSSPPCVEVEGIKR